MKNIRTIEDVEMARMEFESLSAELENLLLADSKLVSMLNHTDKYSSEVLSDIYAEELSELNMDNLSEEGLKEILSKTKKKIGKMWQKIKDGLYNLFMDRSINEKVWDRSMANIPDPSKFKIRNCVPMDQLKTFFIEFNKVVESVNKLYSTASMYTNYKNSSGGVTGLITGILFAKLLSDCIGGTDFKVVGQAMTYKNRFTMSTKTLADDDMDKFDTWADIGRYYKATKRNVTGYTYEHQGNFNLIIIFNKTLKGMVIEQYANISEAEQWLRDNRDTATAIERSDIERATTNTHLLIMFINKIINVFISHVRYFESMWATIAAAGKR